MNSKNVLKLNDEAVLKLNAVDFLNEVLSCYPEFKEKFQPIIDEMVEWKSKPEGCKNEEDVTAFAEMIADDVSPFGSKHMPMDMARMIAQTICPDTLLKEEIELLKSEEGQAHLYVTMLKDAHATEVLVGGGKGLFRRG